MLFLALVNYLRESGNARVSKQKHSRPLEIKAKNWHRSSYWPKQITWMSSDSQEENIAYVNDKPHGHREGEELESLMQFPIDRRMLHNLSQLRRWENKII